MHTSSTDRFNVVEDALIEARRQAEERARIKRLAQHVRTQAKCLELLTQVVKDHRARIKALELQMEGLRHD